MGVVITRPCDRARDASGLEFLVVKPKPKTPGDAPKFTFLRGTRQYFDIQAGVSYDVPISTGSVPRKNSRFTRKFDVETGAETCAREIKEEAGLVMTPKQFTESSRPLGIRKYQREREPGSYDIFWYHLQIKNRFKQVPPEDSLEVRWVTRAEMQALNMAKSYLDLADEVIAGPAKSTPPQAGRPAAHGR